MIYWFYQGLILRIAGAAVVSFLVVLLLGPQMIRFLLRRKIGERPEFDHADLNELTRHKSNTPTMGGALIVLAVLAAVLLFADTHNSYVRMALVALVWLGVLGGVDDWFKLRRTPGQPRARDGLRASEKLLFQVGLAVLLAIWTYRYGRESTVEVVRPNAGPPTPSGALGTPTKAVGRAAPPWGQAPPGGEADAASPSRPAQADTEPARAGEEVVRINPAHSLWLPFRADPIPLTLLAYAIVTVLTMVGASNAVNLTDGMDGLAAGCVVIVSVVLLLLAEIVGVRDWARFFRLPLVAGAVEMTIICAAMIGACLGFLWYNAHPAQVFMGDTGSLALGGLIGYIAVVTRQELVLVIAGGVFVVEAVSVVLQVGYFKLTRPRGGLEGRRLFRCAPLHHHFHLSGWAETKVVIRFWLLAILFAALALATLKLR